MPSSATGIKQLLLISGTSTMCLAASALWLYWRRQKTKNPEEDAEGKNKEAQKKCVQMQPDLWADIVDWLPAPTLARGLSVANRQLHQICAPKMYEQHPHIVNALTVEDYNYNVCGWDNFYNDNEEENCNCKNYEEERKRNIQICKRLWDSDFSECRDFSAPMMEPTPNILGFRKINFRIINDGALAFLRNILRKFVDNSVPMCLEKDGGSSEYTFKQLLEFHNILQGKAASLCVDNDNFYDLYWKHCRPFLMSLQFLIFDDGFDDEYMEIVCIWLQCPRADGWP